jgi:uncharacterized repeat protein (TIGR04138 family)
MMVKCAAFLGPYCAALPNRVGFSGLWRAWRDFVLMMQSIDFEGELSRIVETDSRYDREAYVFLRQALDFCHRTEAKAGKRIRVTEKTGENHVSVARLLDGIREYALQEYGPMAMMVLNSWGVKSCEDFGEIVFKMVEHRLLSVTEQDTREEFRKGFDFFAAFRAPFLPAKGKKTDKPAIEPSST